MSAFESVYAARKTLPTALIKSIARRYNSRPLARPCVGSGSRKQEPIGESAVVNAAALRAEQVSESTLQPALRECVTRAVRRYLHDLDSQMPDGLYDLVLQEVETPLLREVLAWAGGNQSKAAAALGINRATLRKKLGLHGIG
jgi:Fis family transcriptional regulator